MLQVLLEKDLELELTAGYRFTARLGVELGVNYYTSNDKTMAQTTDQIVPITASWCI